MMQGYLGSAIASLRALYVKEDCSQDLSDFATVCREFATVCRDVTELSRNCFNCRCCCCYTNVNNANNWCLYFTRKYLFSLFNWTQLKHMITSDLWIRSGLLSLPLLPSLYSLQRVKLFTEKEREQAMNLKQGWIISIFHKIFGAIIPLRLITFACALKRW